MLEQWQCPPHRMRTVRRRIYAAHLTVYRGIIEQLEQVEIDAFPTAFVTTGSHGGQVHRTAQLFDRYHARFNCRQNDTCIFPGTAPFNSYCLPGASCCSAFGPLCPLERLGPALVRVSRELSQRPVTRSSYYHKVQQVMRFRCSLCIWASL
jgi:hypothetical protein